MGGQFVQFVPSQQPSISSLSQTGTLDALQEEVAGWPAPQEHVPGGELRPGGYAVYVPTGVTVRVVGRASLPGQWHVEDHAGVGKLRQSTELAPIAEVTPRAGEAPVGEAAL